MVKIYNDRYIFINELDNIKKKKNSEEGYNLKIRLLAINQFWKKLNIK